MEFNLYEFAKEVHRNAVEHGWWEGERCSEEILALIHSEWSEALEEYRAGRPLVWHKCPFNNGVCENQEVHTVDAPECAHCSPEMRKPEGVAVELVDGCIRILDYFGRAGYSPNKNLGFVADMMVKDGETVPKAVAMLHMYTAAAMEKSTRRALSMALFYALEYVHELGVDPIALMKEKHEYNKTRPYKHGGKVC